MVRLFILFLVVYSAIRVARQIVAALQEPPRGPQASPRGEAQGRARASGYASSSSSQPPPPSGMREAVPLTPWEVLGVSPNASKQEVKRAYQTLVRQYHPDKVSDLGAELRELAERRTKEINAAYNQLKRSF